VTVTKLDKAKTYQSGDRLKNSCRGFSVQTGINARGCFATVLGVAKAKRGNRRGNEAPFSEVKPSIHAGFKSFVGSDNRTIIIWCSEAQKNPQTSIESCEFFVSEFKFQPTLGYYMIRQQALIRLLPGLSILCDQLGFRPLKRAVDLNF
jgi:hypothetical protein